jgi:hypothetical protein
MRQYHAGVIPKEQSVNFQIGGQLYGINDLVERDLQVLGTAQYEINSVVYAGGYYLELPCSAVQAAMVAASLMAAVLVAATWTIWRKVRKRRA